MAIFGHQERFPDPRKDLNETFRENWKKIIQAQVLASYPEASELLPSLVKSFDDHFPKDRGISPEDFNAWFVEATKALHLTMPPVDFTIRKQHD